MPDKNIITRWIKYLYSKLKREDKEIEKLKKEIEDIKKKEELLGEGVVELYEKKKTK
jgi:predicted RNase H-like nuclease (RuvC/YqgF family)